MHKHTQAMPSHVEKAPPAMVVSIIILSLFYQRGGDYQ